MGAFLITTYKYYAGTQASTGQTEAQVAQAVHFS